MTAPWLRVQPRPRTASRQVDPQLPHVAGRADDPHDDRQLRQGAAALHRAHGGVLGPEPARPLPGTGPVGFDLKRAGKSPTGGTAGTRAWSPLAVSHRQPGDLASRGRRAGSRERVTGSVTRGPGWVMARLWPAGGRSATGCARGGPRGLAGAPVSRGVQSLRAVPRATRGAGRSEPDGTAGPPRNPRPPHRGQRPVSRGPAAADWSQSCPPPPIVWNSRTVSRYRCPLDFS